MIALALVVALAGAPADNPAPNERAPASDVAAPAPATDADPDAAAERAAGELAGKIATGKLDAATLGGDAPIGVATPSTTTAAPPPPPLPDLPPAQSLGIGELVGQLVKMLLMLAVVVALAYLTLNKGLGKLVERQNAGKRVKVVERVALDQKRSLFLVEIDGKQLLLAAGEGGVVHLRDVDTHATSSATQPKSAPTGFAETLKRAVAGDPPVTTGLAKAVEDKPA